MKLSNFLLAGFTFAVLLNTSCTGLLNQQRSVDYMVLYEQENRTGNNARALRYLEKAAEQKDPEALARLGEAYLNGRYGLDDPAKALALLQEAAGLNNARAMTDLGIMYLDGKGVGKDYNAAISWFKQATDAGDMKAPRYLGLIYKNGLVEKVNYKRAAEYFQIAADKGDITGQYHLGRLYEYGLGVKRDYQQAFDLYQKSAARGDRISLPAIMALGNLYEKGLGVEKDISNALIWYTKAAALGDAEAKKKVAKYQYPENPYLMDITAVVKIIGDGQKVTAVVIEYKDAINPDSVDISDFEVVGEEIVSAYVSNKADLLAAPVTGNFVILKLKTEIDESSAEMGGGPEQQDGTFGQNISNNSPPAGFTGPQLGQLSDKPAEPVTLTAIVSQIGDIATKTGEIIAAEEIELESNVTLNPDIEGFVQLVFHDEKYHRNLMYNLFVPENYDPAKKYPLVLFMHDAGAVSNNPVETLTQGLGAVVWASEEDQARHPSFVLAPQYDRVIVGDGSKYIVDLDMTIDLIKALMQQYSIDEDRLYNTGQSMGGMTSIAMDIKYPDFFAASFLVACQWNPKQVAPIADKPLWIVVSQGDNKAYPGMNAITEVLKKYGATVTKAVWNAEADEQTQASNVKKMLKKKRSIHYTVFKGGSHRYTWQYAYSIDGIRDWLFRQHK